MNKVPVSTFQELSILHKALLLGQLLFIGIVFGLIYAKLLVPAMAAQDKFLQVVVIIISGALLLISGKLFKKKIQVIKNSNYTNNEKAAKYKSACIMQWVLTEIISLIAGMAFFLTGNFSFLALAGFMVILMILYSPTVFKMAVHTQLTEQEIKTV